MGGMDSSVLPKSHTLETSSDLKSPAGLCNGLAALVEANWKSFVSPVWINGKPNACGLVCEATHVVFTVFSILVRLFKMQCRKVEVKPVLENLYICPALAEAE